MMPSRSSPQIKCPIHLFEDCERDIERLTATINRASAPQDKGRLARELVERVSMLLDCDAYDQSKPDCRLCRDVSTLRLKTANVIDKAAALGR
jgi:hypothetical protein